ncbi:hypothetical protein TRFO_10700 [Tritrichomonas foetus]|uniref:USP domain-containing protein n=1 Tax=Tritrichomonas foetus TaxID=1144522 RepID=A0A1J4J9W1_9EUKA|nr:hypothetical protein TRFO_10700 [Tritrichomonas foetus]|eukprot:OHS95007.1 hypothetical protein TRFO_10700 [Tritrichomonas foetus]
MGCAESNPLNLNTLPEGVSTIRLPNHFSCCFINSVTQCLLNLDEVQKFLLKFGNIVIEHKLDEIFTATTLGCLAKMYLYISDSKLADCRVDNMNYLQSIYSQYKDFTPDKESDAHEFLLYTFTSFDETVDQVNNIIGKPVISLFTSLFEVDVTNFVQCGCGKSITNLDQYNAISIPAEYQSISTCINHFLKPNRGLANYLVCHKELKFSNCRQITLLPKIFVLHFMRFTIKNNRYIKNDRCIPILETISLRTTETENTYTLQSMVIHLGRSINTGHYVTVYRSNNFWLLADDARTRVLPQEEVDELFSFGTIRSDYDSPAIYMMFYAKEEK